MPNRGWTSHAELWFTTVEVIPVGQETRDGQVSLFLNFIYS